MAHINIHWQNAMPLNETFELREAPCCRRLGIFHEKMTSMLQLFFCYLDGKINQHLTLISPFLEITRGIQIHQRTPWPTWKCQHHTVRLVLPHGLQSCSAMILTPKIPATLQGHTFASLQTNTACSFRYWLCVSVNLSDKWIWKFKGGDEGIIHALPNFSIMLGNPNLVDLKTIRGDRKLVSSVLLPCLRYHLTQARLQLAPTQTQGSIGCGRPSRMPPAPAVRGIWLKRFSM